MNERDPAATIGAHGRLDPERRFAAFMAHLPGLAWIKDAAGRYVFANDPALAAFRRTREQLYGRTDREIFPPATAEQFRANDERALKLGSRLRAIETLEHDDGVHHSLVIKFPIPGAGGDPAFVGGIAIDISDRIRIEAALNALLDAPRAGAEATSVLRPAADLRAIVDSAIALARPRLDAVRHELIVALPEEPVLVRADAAALTQCFANLLDNAAKFTPAGGIVEVRLDADGRRARVAIRDNGIGIEPGTDGRVLEGLGIGLVSSRHIAELHGGRITVQSEGARKGSEFMIDLPMTDSPAPATPSARRVLIVDDNRDAADTLRQLAAILGNEVEVAYDGRSAVAAFERFAPSIVLCDIGLPGMDGYQIATELRSRACGPLTLVAVTGFAQDEDRRRTAAAGFDHHLVKPIEFETLTTLLGGA